MPTPAQVSGTWVGSQVYRTVSGGGCVGADLQTPHTGFLIAYVTQTGSSLSVVNQNQVSLSSCADSGTLNGNAATLISSVCDAYPFAFTCSNGTTLTVKALSEQFTLAFNGQTATGTLTQVWAVGSAEVFSPMTVSATVSLGR